MMQNNLCADQVTRTSTPSASTPSATWGHEPACSQRGAKDQQNEATRVEPPTFFCCNDDDKTTCSRCPEVPPHAM